MGDDSDLRKKVDRLDRAVYGNGSPGLITTVAKMHQTLEAIQDDIKVRRQNSYTLNINLLATAALLLMWIVDKWWK